MTQQKAAFFYSQQRQKAKEMATLIVNATAGSGKTTTIVDGLASIRGQRTSYIPSSEQLKIWDWMNDNISADAEVIVCAFNNAIADELKTRLTFGTGTTIHALGCRIMRENGIRIGRPDTWKTANLYMQFISVKEMKDLSKTQRAILDDVREMVKICKDNVLTEHDISIDTLSILALDNEYSWASSPAACEEAIKYILEVGSFLPERQRAFAKSKSFALDFDDMIYIPARYKMSIKADCLIVDEAQDLSAGKLTLLSSQQCKHFIFVGDPNQAIFAFAGAQTDSFSKIAEVMHDITTLPLSCTYRCGKAIVSEAQQLVGDAINAGASNPEGKVCRIVDTDMQLEEGDMLVSRVNAPLMQIAWKLVRAKKPCKVVGRSIGTGLTRLINKLTDKQNVSSITLAEKIEEWRSHQIALLQKKKYDTESRQIAINDQADCIMQLCSECQTSGEIINFISEIFNDKERNVIRLSSIHRAKGLEADNVYFYNPENVPHPLAKTQEAIKQEYNLRFVAITRARNTLTYVTVPKKSEKTIDTL